jgi:hypothetical protein
MTTPKVDRNDLKGYSSRVTKRGIRVVELDAWADPARDSKWLNKARAESASEQDFQREVMRNWNISSGDGYYPEFTELGRERYVMEFPELLDLPVVRGWDFGVRGPVVVWMQYSAESDRVFVLREWAPRGIAAHHFRDVSRWLSGQMEIGSLEPTSRDWADLLLELPGPTPPWFPEGVTFYDYAGTEIEPRQSIAARDPREATLRGVWAAGGIEFATHTGGVKTRRDVLRRLLYPRPDGYPGILISPSCTEVLATLDGGLVFKKATALNPKPTDPKKDGRFDNVNDAVTYAIVGVVPATEPDTDVQGWEQEEVGWSM